MKIDKKKFIKILEKTQKLNIYIYVYRKQRQFFENIFIL